jgi:ABC-type Fe3+/spermidine/putrescine transport system ATPase subunit
MPLVRLKGVSKSYGKHLAVCPLDLDIYPRDFLAILGPSGCGKTTLLRIIGGFVRPTSGVVEIDGADVTRLGPERRPTNMVFQGYGLFPHMNVRQNVGYGLRLKKLSAEDIQERVEAAIRLVHLSDLASRGIGELSGGQQQRVALARALVMRPKVLLLDEPLAALDLKLRHAMQEELRRIHEEIGGTFVFVTHDQGEALGLANRIAVMHAGRLEQEGEAHEIYTAPKTRFVSTFVGEANLLQGVRAGGVVTLDEGTAFPDAGPDGPVSVVIRPEHVFLPKPGQHSDIELSGTVGAVVYLGTHTRVTIRLRNREAVTANVSPDEPTQAVGETLRVGWSAHRQRVLED